MSKNIAAVIVAAMDEEIEPFANHLATSYTFQTIAHPTYMCRVYGRGSTRIILLRSGVGTAAAAGALAWVLGLYTPRIVVNIGMAGGFKGHVSRHDVVVGTRFAYGFADCTAFGYAMGQLPGQPQFFEASSSVVEVVDAVNEVRGDDAFSLKHGLILSSDRFITDDDATLLTERFPEALACDMESAALAQTCYSFNLPFVAIRAISDLCNAATPDEEVEAGQLSAEVAKAILEHLGYLNSPQVQAGINQYFDTTALRAALIAVLGYTYRTQGTPDQVRAVPDALVNTVQMHISDVEHQEEALRYIAGGLALIRSGEPVKLAAKKYDKCRAEIVRRMGITSGRGQLEWPPTSQTFIKRYRYWSEALESVGLKAQQGRQRGGLKFQHEDYILAVQNYLHQSERERMPASYSGYQRHASLEHNRGRIPSGPSIRQYFGSWRNALEAIALAENEKRPNRAASLDGPLPEGSAPVE